jgi:hypothetical protein
MAVHRLSPSLPQRPEDPVREDIAHQLSAAYPITNRIYADIDLHSWRLAMPPASHGHLSVNQDGASACLEGGSP